MDLKAPVGLAITTYEVSEEGFAPTLTHIFWGDDLKDAIGVAKSHLITDLFFSSSFEGEMPWGDDVLLLTNDYELIGKYKESNVKNIISQLSDAAVSINDRKVEKGIVRQIQLLSK